MATGEQSRRSLLLNGLVFGAIFIAALGYKAWVVSDGASSWVWLWLGGMAVYVVIFALAGIWVFLSRDPRPSSSPDGER